MSYGPLVLLILDGIGDGARNAFDAPFVAGMPNLNGLRRRYAATQLRTSEEAVGLPEGQFGNSEVGHMNLGAGRVVYQDFTRVTKAIRDGEFFGLLGPSGSGKSTIGALLVRDGRVRAVGRYRDRKGKQDVASEHDAYLEEAFE